MITHIAIPRVYEVFNDQNEILALKVVNLKESRIQEELLGTIHILRERGGRWRGRLENANFCLCSVLKICLYSEGGGGQKA